MKLFTVVVFLLPPCSTTIEGGKRRDLLQVAHFSVQLTAKDPNEMAVFKADVPWVVGVCLRATRLLQARRTVQAGPGVCCVYTREWVDGGRPSAEGVPAGQGTSSLASVVLLAPGAGPSDCS